MSEQTTLAIPNDVLKPIIEARISTAIASALGDEKQLVADAITHILKQKVSKEGKHENYEHYNTENFIQWLAKKYIREAVDKAVREHIQESMPQIKEQVKKVQ